MKKLFLFSLSAIALSGCTTFHPTVPEAYYGPTASIVDTEKRLDVGKADLFYLSKIDGKDIYNSRYVTGRESYGKGNVLTTVMLNHRVQVKEQSFSIVGRTEYAMPARALVSTVYEIKGEITFTPEENKIYMVKGDLSDKESLVWLEDRSTGEIIDIIQMDGASKLGLFKK